MNKKFFIILLLVVVSLLTVSYCHFGWGPKKDETGKTLQEEALPAASPSMQKVKEKAATPPLVVKAVQAKEAQAQGFLPTQMEDPELLKSYQKALKEMSVCLNMRVSAMDPQAQMNFDYFNSLISEDLGDIVAQEEDWVVTDVRTKSGEYRRVYVENHVDANGATSRKLKHLSITPGGMQSELPLTPEQSASPSEALIASLEADGDVVSRSVSRRIFYQNGDDLVLVEKDGKIYSYSLPHDGRTYSCTGADSAATMVCQCK